MKPITNEKITMRRGEWGFTTMTIESIDDIKNYVSEQKFYKKDVPSKMTWDKNYLTLNFYKEIVTFDQNVIFPDAPLAGHGVHYISDFKYINTFNGHPIINLDSKRFYIYVMEKLQYADDIKKYLDDSYAGTIDFCHVATDKPIAFAGYRTETYRLMGKRYPIIMKEPAYSYIQNTDTVVDKNLNQIWPIATGKMPTGLVELFGKER